MPEYEITLTKAYTVRIKAESAESAARLAEFYRHKGHLDPKRQKNPPLQNTGNRMHGERRRGE